MQVEQQAAAALKWHTIAKVVSQAFSWAVTLIVVRLLAPEDYGLMAVSTVIVSIIAGTAEFGLGSSLIQAAEPRATRAGTGCRRARPLQPGLWRRARGERAVDRDAVQRAGPRSRHSSLDTAFRAVCDRGRAAGAHAARNEIQEQCRHRGRRGGRRQRHYAGPRVARCRRVGTRHRQPRRRRRAYRLFVLLGTFVLPSFVLTGIGKHIRFGGQVTAARFLWQFTYQLDTLIAARFLNGQAVGLYSVSMHLATMPVSKTMAIVNQVAFPAVARLQNELPRMRARLLEALRLLAFVAIPALWGLSATAHEFVDVVLGAKWHEAVLPLMLVSLIAPARMLMALFATAASAIGRADLEVRNTLVGALVLPVAFLIGVQASLDRSRRIVAGGHTAHPRGHAATDLRRPGTAPVERAHSRARAR